MVKIEWEEEVGSKKMIKLDFAYFIDLKSAKSFQKNLIKYKKLTKISVITENVSWGE